MVKQRNKNNLFVKSCKTVKNVFWKLKIWWGAFDLYINMHDFKKIYLLDSCKNVKQFKKQSWVLISLNDVLSPNNKRDLIIR